VDVESDAQSEDVSEDREKRSIFPFVVGETILDIQCKRGYLTVCAPDGPNACPVAYSSQTNVGACGFATLNHFLNTTNIAGTCCYKLPGSSALGATTTTTGRSILLPQIVAYPVYAQYPYALSSGSSSSSGSGSSSSGYGKK
jgi:hypothetical protein